MNHSKDTFEVFHTKIDGVRFLFQAGYEDKSQQFYAQAFVGYRDIYCNTVFSDKSIEDAILNLVKLLERTSK